MLRSWFSYSHFVTLRGPFDALTGFFTHHIGFGCFVSLFHYYDVHTHPQSNVFPLQSTRALRIPSTIYWNDLWQWCPTFQQIVKPDPERFDPAQPAVVSERWTGQVNTEVERYADPRNRRKKVYGPSTVDVCVHVYVQLLGEKRYTKIKQRPSWPKKKKQCNERESDGG